MSCRRRVSVRCSLERDYGQLIYVRGIAEYDPLTALTEEFSGVTVTTTPEDHKDWPVDERLSQRIIDGNMTGLEDDLEEAMASGVAPLAIINETLLGGMKVVGELFGSGEMQLPFVLRSAETVKRAVAYLEPLMEKGTSEHRGSIVLVTVRGDVHDIGRNLVDIILSNNGFDVHNLGIKVGISEILDAYEEYQADAIGMSGLLVKSTLVMRDNLEELTHRGLDHVPVLLGGAALTRTYVESDLREVYPGPLFYGKDAFDGLDVMEQIGQRGQVESADATFGRVEIRRLPERRPVVAPGLDGRPERSPEVATDNEVFTPPFLGSRVIKGISLDEIGAYINETALFRNQWQFRPENGETDPGKGVRSFLVVVGDTRPQVEHMSHHYEIVEHLRELQSHLPKFEVGMTTRFRDWQFRRRIDASAEFLVAGPVIDPTTVAANVDRLKRDPADPPVYLMVVPPSAAAG